MDNAPSLEPGTYDNFIIEHFEPKPLNGGSSRESLPWLDMSNWDSEPIPERKWAIRDRAPANQVGLFSGEGGPASPLSS